MQQLKERLEAATMTFEDARQRLERARDAYVNGPGKLYAETRASVGELASLATEYKQSHEDARTALEKAMLGSRGKITLEVKVALTARRDAEDLIEQSEMLEQQAERNRAAVFVDASQAAAAYVSAYEQAAQQWAEMNVLDALIECGERIARAMAVVPAGEALIPYTLRANQRLTICRNLMLTELDALCASFKAEANAYEHEIGQLALGALQIDDMLSPASRKKVLETLRDTTS